MVAISSQRNADNAAITARVQHDVMTAHRAETSHQSREYQSLWHREDRRTGRICGGPRSAATTPNRAPRAADELPPSPSRIRALPAPTPAAGSGIPAGRCRLARCRSRAAGSGAGPAIATAVGSARHSATLITTGSGTWARPARLRAPPGRPVIPLPREPGRRQTRVHRPAAGCGHVGTRSRKPAAARRMKRSSAAKGRAADCCGGGMLARMPRTRRLLARHPRPARPRLPVRGRAVQAGRRLT